jgi:hypothetical protein
LILLAYLQLWTSSLCIFLQPHVTSSLFGPNILVNTLFSNTLSLYTSLNDRDQVSYPHKTIGKIIVLYILINFRQQTRKQNVLDWMVVSIARVQSRLISSWIRFWFVIDVTKYLNCATFSKHLLLIFMPWFCSAVWWPHSNIYLVFSVFTSRPTSLPALIKVCVSLYGINILIQ